MKNFILILFLVLPALIKAQSTIYVSSNYLKKDVPILVQEPDDLKPSRKYPIVIMLHGYSEDYTQWDRIANLKELANNFQMILICPEGYQNFYINSPLINNYQYEDFFFKELATFIFDEYSVDKNNIFITGLSMGGYGALHLDLKKPEFFNTAASSSGALELDYESFRKVS